MKKVFQLLNKAKPIDGEIGIEIECEGRNLNVVDHGGWKTEQDGSLRGDFPHSAAEYVLTKPIKACDVEEKVAYLRKEQEGATMDFSFRTSVHIHVNVQDLTEAEVMNVVYTYLLLEEPMVNFCGRERKGNRFCLRISDAEGIIDYYSKMFSRGLKFIMGVNENDLRYAGINLASLKKYGSVEFRSMRGCMDADTLHIWANSLMAIKKYAQKYKAPVEIMQEFGKGSPRDFLRSVLGEYAVYYEYPRMAKEIQRSFSLTLELPFVYKEVIEPPKEAEPEFSALVKYCRAELGLDIKEANIEAGYIRVNYNRIWQNWRKATPEQLEEFAEFIVVKPNVVKRIRVNAGQIAPVQLEHFDGDF